MLKGLESPKDIYFPNSGGILIQRLGTKKPFDTEECLQNCIKKINYKPSFRKGFKIIIQYLYYVQKQLIRTLFEAHIVFRSFMFLTRKQIYNKT